MSVENAVKEVLKKVLDVDEGQIRPDESLEDSLDVDSTEMVEISVGLKKTLNVNIGDNELKKTHSPNQIAEILKGKGVAS